MTDAARELAGQVHELMRKQADLLDELEQSRKDARQDRDALLRELLGVMDSTQRASERVRNKEARAVFTAVTRQIELIFVSAGMVTFTFEPGASAPLAEIDVVDTVNDPSLADLAVARTLQAGLRDNERIIRKATVEINRLQQDEEA